MTDTDTPTMLSLRHEHSAHPKVKRLVATLYDELLSSLDKKQKKPKQLQETLSYMVLRLYRAGCIGAHMGVTIPAEEAPYARGTRLEALGFSHAATMMVLKWLLESEYALTLKPAKQYHSNAQVDGPCYGPTRDLIDLFKEHQVRLIDFHEEEDLETVIELRDKHNVAVSHKVPRELKESQKLLMAYNALLQKSYIDWDEALKSFSVPIDKTNKTVKRIFHDTWNQGGRFHSGWWQHLPQRDRERTVESGFYKTKVIKNKRRPFILIDGELTTEIDFKCMQVMMIYLREGVDFRPHSLATEVGYDIYGSIRFSDDAVKDRNLVKLAISVGIEGKNRKHTYNTLLVDISEDVLSFPFNAESSLGEKVTDEALHTIYQKIIETHPPLKHWLFCGRGPELQFCQSLVIEHVIREFTYHLNVPCLSVHDSLVVPNLWSKRLTEVMMQSLMEFAAQYGPPFDYQPDDLLDLTHAMSVYEKALLWEMMPHDLGLSAHMDMNGNLNVSGDSSISQEEWFQLLDMPVVNAPVWKRRTTWKKEGNTLPFDRWND